MSELFRTDTLVEARQLSPAQAEFYTGQLRAMAGFALHGAGAELGAGSHANQLWLPLQQRAPQNISTFTWQPSETDGAVTHFAALPPQNTAHRYFGTAVETPGSRPGFFVEGVDMHPAHGHYGKLLVDYKTDLLPSARLPLAIQAFVGSMQEHALRHQSSEGDLPGIDPRIHKRLGGALLSFWQTLCTGPGTEALASRPDDVYDMAALVLDRHTRNAGKSNRDIKYDFLEPYVDARGNTTGFIGMDRAQRVIVAMLRDNTQYPNAIHHLERSQPQYLREQANNLWTHYVFTENGVSARMTEADPAVAGQLTLAEQADLVRNDPQPFATLSQQEATAISRQLFADFESLQEAA